MSVANSSPVPIINTVSTEKRYRSHEGHAGFYVVADFIAAARLVIVGCHLTAVQRRNRFSPITTTRELPATITMVQPRTRIARSYHAFASSGPGRVPLPTLTFPRIKRSGLGAEIW